MLNKQLLIHNRFPNVRRLFNYLRSSPSAHHDLSIYKALFGAEKVDIGIENTYSLDINTG